MRQPPPIGPTKGRDVQEQPSQPPACQGQPRCRPTDPPGQALRSLPDGHAAVLSNLLAVSYPL